MIPLVYNWRRAGGLARRILQIIWDSIEDSDEFFEAYKTFATIKTMGAGGTSESIGDSGRKWVTPDEVVFLGQIGPAALLIIGDDEETVQLGLDEFFKALQPPTP